MTQPREGRWRRRMGLAASVRLLAFGVPVVLAVGLTTLANWLLPVPESAGQRVAWWVILLLVVAGALVTGDRLARRLLPLAAFLELSLAFPDRAPSRFRMALRSSSTRQLERRVDRLRREALAGDPAEAAAGVLELVAMLTAHDRVTRGHSERVRAYVDLLADEMGVTPTARDRLRWAALLHDVGKVAVPAEVLNKPGSLDPGEWEQVKAHPLEGERLTVSLRPWLGEWASAVGQHHERWDGSGYPRGLRGSEISLGARIVAVADAFEVMTASRPYKQPMAAAAARRELVRVAAVQFDPAVVRAFLNISLGRLHSAMGLFGWLGQLPFVERVPFRTVASGAARVVLTGSTLVAGGLVHVPAPQPGSAKVPLAMERQPAPTPGTPALAALTAEEPASPPAGPVRTAPKPPVAPAPVGSPPATPDPAPPPAGPTPPEEAPSPPDPLPEQPVPTEPPGRRGLCTAFLHGSSSGGVLAEAADAIGQTIEQLCDLVRAATGVIINLGLVAGSPEFEDPGRPVHHGS